MSKKVPVYLSEEEIKAILGCMENTNAIFGLDDADSKLFERLEAELATFEE